VDFHSTDIHHWESAKASMSHRVTQLRIPRTVLHSLLFWR
jgi:hypothetical protein